MWRDILLIIGFVFTGLMYFGLTPKRLAKYAETAKVDITQKSPRQKRYLFVAVALTPLYIFIAIWGVEDIGLAYSLMMIAILVFLWGGTVTRVWKLSERWKKVARSVKYAGMFSLLLTATILSDTLLWQKFAFPLSGIGIGFGILVLSAYMRKKRENKLLSQEDDKDSPL